MYGYFLSENRLWLDRMLIDKQYQGLGIGRKMIALLLKRLYQEYPECNMVTLSVYSDNIAAIHLYQEYGFVFTGELDTKGELIMVRPNL